MRQAVLIGMSVLLLAGGLSGARAVPSPDLQAIAVANEQAERAALRARQLEAQAQRARNEAERARIRSDALASRIDTAEARLTAAETQLALIERLRAEQHVRLAERQEPALRLAAALQTMARRPPALALIQPGSIEDSIHIRSLLAATLPEIRRRTASLRAELARTGRLRRQAETARRVLSQSREELRLRRVALARFEARQRTESEGLTGLALAESDRALAFGEEAHALARLAGTREYQARLEADLSELPGPLPRPGTPPAPPSLSRRPAPFLLAVNGRVVTGVGEISESGVHARGLTLATEPGARVIAPAAGKIVYAGPFRSYGQILIIDHGGGWTSVLTGLAELGTAAGRTVRRAEPVGRTGRSRPTVTIELRREGRPVPLAQLVSV